LVFVLRQRLLLLLNEAFILSVCIMNLYSSINAKEIRDRKKEKQEKNSITNTFITIFVLRLGISRRKKNWKISKCKKLYDEG